MLSIVTVTILEVVTGVFTILLALHLGRDLPRADRPRFRGACVALSVLFRLLLLAVAPWALRFESTPAILRGAILTGGIVLSLFAVLALRRRRPAPTTTGGRPPSLPGRLGMFALLTLPLALDGTLNAIGMAASVWPIVVSLLLAGGAMWYILRRIARLYDGYPTVQTAGMASLLLLSASLALRGAGLTVPSGPAYLLVLFSMGVEALNARQRLVPRHIREEWGDRETEEATVMFVDLRGSTELLEKVGAQTGQALLTDLLGRVLRIVEEQDGDVERTLGDGLIAVFREREQPGAEHHALRCLRCVGPIRGAVGTVSARWRATHGAQADVTIGIETGLIAGALIRSDRHEEWSSFGPVVNLAARLQRTCETLGVPLLIGPGANRFAERWWRTRAVGAVPLKGFARPIQVYTLAAGEPNPTGLAC